MPTNDVVASMPHPTLIAVTGTPTFTSIRVLKQEFFADAVAIDSSSTSPDLLVHAVLILGTDAYNVVLARL